ncbi:hypothetical protein GXM_03852 [Nostoc sphaeroides CCNUC1]|uniref:Uncharacterized protein n=1 Tax=Nostoc sphaeroides CCNUC1 TaxID=2653204 RepID=A0A5P8W197_9NOSO|nr:hypothetical protein GXM_03852 [Nostoc sphaeroides CCNUC1]
MGWLQKFDFFSKITENCLHLRYAGFKRLNSSDFQKAESSMAVVTASLLHFEGNSLEII